VSLVEGDVEVDSLVVIDEAVSGLTIQTTKLQPFELSVINKGNDPLYRPNYV